MTINSLRVGLSSNATVIMGKIGQSINKSRPINLSFKLMFATASLRRVVWLLGILLVFVIVILLYAYIRVLFPRVSKKCAICLGGRKKPEEPRGTRVTVSYSNTGGVKQLESNYPPSSVDE